MSTPTARRLTEQAGAAYVALQTAEVERLEQHAPVAPAGPPQQVFSADGALIGLVGGVWAEVRTVVIGTVQATVSKNGTRTVQTQALSYFSRLANAEDFTQLALVETHRRGVENAGQVGALMDGALWLQAFTDYHRPDAQRILDFPHASDYVHQIGQAEYGLETPALAQWTRASLHTLKHEGPQKLLAELNQLVQAHPEVPTLVQAYAYLENRIAQMQYPVFQAAGWPIGSGIVESGNKLVVEARLKGAGMHWAPAQVNPMLALRNIVCNDRWDEAWPQILTHLRTAQYTRRADARQRRHPAPPPPPPLRVNPSPPPPAVPKPTAEARTSTPAPYKPPPDHPWRRGYEARMARRALHNPPKT